METGAERRADRKTERAEKKAVRKAERLKSVDDIENIEDLDEAIKDVSHEIEQKEAELAELAPDEDGTKLENGLGDLSKEKARLVELKEAYIDVKEAEAEGLEEKADKLREKSAEYLKTEKRLAEIETELTAEGITDAEKEKLYVERADLNEKLDKLDAQDRKLARAEKLEESAAEHEKEAAEADTELKEALGQLEAEEGEREEAEEGEKKEGEEGAPEAAEGEGAEEGEEKPGEVVSITDRFSKVSFGLAQDIAQNPPDKEKVLQGLVTAAKTFMLRIFTFMGSEDKEWANDLSKDEKETLEKSIGMAVVEKTNDDGEMITTIEWKEPDPDYKPPPKRAIAIFREHFGDAGHKELLADKVKRSTTVKQFEEMVDEMPEGSDMRDRAKVLLTVVREHGANDNTKLLAYLESNSVQLKDKLVDARAEATLPELAPEEEEEDGEAVVEEGEEAPAGEQAEEEEKPNDEGDSVIDKAAKGTGETLELSIDEDVKARMNELNINIEGDLIMADGNELSLSGATKIECSFENEVLLVRAYFGESVREYRGRSAEELNDNYNFKKYLDNVANSNNQNKVAYSKRRIAGLYKKYPHWKEESVEEAPVAEEAPAGKDEEIIEAGDRLDEDVAKLDKAEAERALLIEHRELSNQMEELARERQWIKVDSTFDKIVVLDVKPGYRDYYLGAQAAGFRGHINEMQSRLLAAKEIQSTDEVVNSLNRINEYFVETRIEGDFKPKDDEKFIAFAKTPIELAQAQAKKEGVYSGLLPRGTYVLADGTEKTV